MQVEATAAALTTHLRQPGFLQSYECVLRGPHQTQTRDHLFFECPFAQSCWKYIYPNYAPQVSIHHNLAEIKDHLQLLTAAAAGMHTQGAVRCLVSLHGKAAAET